MGIKNKNSWLEPPFAPSRAAGICGFWGLWEEILKKQAIFAPRIFSYYFHIAYNAIRVDSCSVSGCTFFTPFCTPCANPHKQWAKRGAKISA